MLTYKDFIEKYEKYTDEELYVMLQTISEYGDDAQKALQQTIENRGGAERLNNAIEEKKKVASEIRRIQNETIQLGKGGVDPEFIKKTAVSEILTADKVQQIVDNQYEYVAAEIADKKVDQQTIGRCIIGGTIATLVSGTALGILWIYTNAIHALIVVGVALLCYVIIKSIAKRSRHNTAVFLTTALAFIMSFVLAYLLFQMIGYKG